jgi:hypothetical protein
MRNITCKFHGVMISFIDEAGEEVSDTPENLPTQKGYSGFILRRCY